MPWDHDDSGYDGPPTWWWAHQSRARARRPLCDEYGTPCDEDEGSDTTEDADEGEE